MRCLHGFKSQYVYDTKGDAVYIPRRFGWTPDTDEARVRAESFSGPNPAEMGVNMTDYAMGHINPRDGNFTESRVRCAQSLKNIPEKFNQQYDYNRQKMQIAMPLLELEV